MHRIKKKVVVVFFLVGTTILVIVGFSGKNRGRVVQGMEIKIENVQSNHFLENKEVEKLMGLNADNLKGAFISELNLGELEKKIRKNDYVRTAELYTDVKGKLIVHVVLNRPVARIVLADGRSRYIAEDGHIMPVSPLFTSRVLLLSGGYFNSLVKAENVKEYNTGGMLMDLIGKIQEDEFWQAQIAQVDISAGGNVIAYPQIGGQVIEFGKMDQWEEKFKKLKIFYKEILPTQGWNKYHRVNIAYEGQIIAE